MTHFTMPATHPLTYALYRFFASFPIACFTLTVFSDVAYWKTMNLLWLHFSEWLLLAGLVFGAIALLLAFIAVLFRWDGPTWTDLIGQLIAYCLAVLNSFIHTADGWTAVIPYGLMVSMATVAIMALASVVGKRRADYV